MSKEGEKKLRLIVWAIVVVAIATAFLGIPQGWTNIIIEWLASIFIGTVFSFFAASLVESLSGDILKSILITIEITDDIRFSISLFAIATIFVKLFFFRQL